jgi:nicotinate-nucleotide pyrophosphorylase (carboxylating)
MSQFPFDTEAFFKSALAEDIGDGDHTSLATIPSSAHGKARLLIKDEGVIAGIEFAEQIFKLVDPGLQVSRLMNDGARVQKGEVAFYVEGPARSITTAERLVLNLMQRMSGVATKTRFICDKVSHTKVKILDTRKTTPGMRYFEKMAVTLGGGHNHRYGLYDMILIKDNHSDYAGGIAQALKQVREYLHSTGRNLKVEAEARNMDEVRAILHDGLAFRILLDNFSPEDMLQAVRFIDGKVETEASGGIDEHNVVSYAETGVDYISLGALTHSVKSLDLSLKAVK